MLKAWLNRCLQMFQLTGYMCRFWLKTLVPELSQILCQWGKVSICLLPPNAWLCFYYTGFKTMMKVKELTHILKGVKLIFWVICVFISVIGDKDKGSSRCSLYCSIIKYCDVARSIEKSILSAHRLHNQIWLIQLIYHLAFKGRLHHKVQRSSTAITQVSLLECKVTHNGLIHLEISKGWLSLISC